MDREDRPQHPWLAYALVALGVVARLAPHPPNVSPLAAIALFSGAHLSKRSALALPLVIVAISDVLIGWHRTVFYVWGAFALTALIGWWVRRHVSPGRIVAGTLAGSVLFFLITNFGVWARGNLYPHTLAGLWQCFIAALPFFRNTVLGDLLYSTALFGTYALASGLRPACQRAPFDSSCGLAQGSPERRRETRDR